MAEYKLSYTASEIDEKLGKIDVIEANKTSDSEIIDMLFELDTINTVTNENGYILTDENDNILLW